MALPKETPTQKHWNSLSEDELANVALSTDTPDRLDNLVFEVPEGSEEPYVEFKYDLTGTGQQEEFSCVHGHHKHLKGFVMRKGDKRFLVGWICGKTIYGESFDQYTADFDAVVNRQRTIRRRKDIEKQTAPFLAWLEHVSQSDVFKHYESVRRQFEARMPWIWENAPLAVYWSISPREAKVPPTLFVPDTDPRADFARVVAEMSALAMNLVARDELEEKSVETVRRTMKFNIGRVERIFDQLKEVIDFFQPPVLELMCNLANQHDNPKRRKYIPGLGSITCKKDRDKITVQMPTNYRLPSRAGLEEVKKAIQVL